MLSDVFMFSSMQSSGFSFVNREFELRSTIENVIAMCALQNKNHKLEIVQCYDSSIPEVIMIGDCTKL